MVGVTAVFWLCRARYRFDLLAVMSLGLLAVWDWRSAVLLMFMAAVTGGITRQREVSGLLAAFGVIGLFLTLLLFKSHTHMTLFVDDSLAILPLGMSYYTLRCAHLIIERYKGGVSVLNWRNLLQYLLFVPTFVIGPIHRFEEFSRSVRRHRWNNASFLDGLERIVIGFAKILLLGVLTTAFLEPIGMRLVGDSAAGQTYVRMVTIGLNLYFYFAGYSDISIGFSRLLGVSVMENFNSPYLSPNISVFWRNWHISLTSWSRDYVYNPTIAATRSPGLGALTSLVFIGLWHDPTWQYLVWGFYHGTAIFIWQRFQKVKLLLPQIKNRFGLSVLYGLSVFLTVHFVWLGFLLVREDTFAGMMSIVSSLMELMI